VNVGFLSDVVAWFTDGAHWWGDFGILARLREHVLLSLAAIAVAVVIAFPPAFWLGHVRRGGALAVNLGNVARAVPSLAVLLIAVQTLGLEEWPLVGSVPALITLVALAIAPILTNTYVGVSEVPDGIRESAVAMGMTGTQRAFRIELPLALPVAVGGLRTASVQVVATATIAALVGAGGLGRFIIDGIAVRDFPQVFGGALLVAALALATEAAFALAMRRLYRGAHG
jgi:osmoprotectant transport system permease protein